MPDDPFHVDTAARPFLSWLMRLDAYRALYRQIRSTPHQPFEARALEVLDIRPSWSPLDVEAIPRRGPLLIAANHPHGGLDGLVLAAIVSRIRPDVRVMANHLLSRIPELARRCFFVDPFGGAAASARSQAGLRAAHMWLRRGGALIIFPAGEVAHARQPDGSYGDSDWRSTVGRLALATRAQVLPSFITGRNRRRFYAAGLVHPALRTALLARELLSARGRTIPVRFGPPIDPADLAEARGDAVAATGLMRQVVDRLGASGRAIAPGQSAADAVAREIGRLPDSLRLVESGAFQVFCAPASRVPSTLLEIGRLREVAYRAVGEGTGARLDLDAFDDRYLHLFLWDRERRQVVGAYRLGQTDRIVAADGVQGLYTRTLFRYDERLIARLSPALELGRSFVRAEYQKNYSALLLLWKGIAEFVARHPEYRVLFGAVSISAKYSDASQQLLMAFLRQNCLDASLADLAQAINPRVVVAEGAPAAPAVPASIDDVDQLVVRAESDGKGVPILLRQYLKLNARLIGFNRDQNFGDALDALMMIDLTTVERPILNRYFGRQGAAAFLARHAGDEAAHAA